jgi:hypothetical protein
MLDIQTNSPAIKINGQMLTFTKTKQGFIYAEVGKAAKVYRVQIGNDLFALKDFYELAQSSSVIKNTQEIKQYKDISGLSVANRSIHKFSKPEPSTVMLMPWVKGTAWFTYVDEEVPLSKSNSLKLAKNFARVLVGLEKKGIAHCDISGKNVFFSKNYERVELVDIEEMYAPGLHPPPDNFFPAGTPGYTPDWVRMHGVWEDKADRYAAGIVLAEILAWHSSEVRQLNSSDDSFFSVEEVGVARSERYQTVKDALSEHSKELVDLFESTWFSQSLEECPTLVEWEENIPEGESLETPILDVFPKFMDFGKITLYSTPRIEVKISNSGTGTLDVKISGNDWLSVTPLSLSIAEDESVVCHVTLKRNFPRHIQGKPFFFPRGIIIDSNGGSEVIGGSFTIKKSFFG